MFYNTFIKSFTTSSVQYSPGLLENNPEQIRNKLKISAYVLETA